MSCNILTTRCWPLYGYLLTLQVGILGAKLGVLGFIILHCGPIKQVWRSDIILWLHNVSKDFDQCFGHLGRATKIRPPSPPLQGKTLPSPPPIKPVNWSNGQPFNDQHLQDIESICNGISLE